MHSNSSTPLSPAVLLVLSLLIGLPDVSRGQLPVSFDHVVVDPSGPQDPWGKAVGDMNGDGTPDLIVGGYVSGGLVWYENPSWVPHVISDQPGFRTDHEAGDVDRDGRMDVVSLGTDPSGKPRLEWFKNPGSPGGTWVRATIEEVSLHDIEIADLNHDGWIDIVGRNQEAYAPGDGDTLRVFLQTSAVQWSKSLIPCVNGEGLKVVDLNRDARPDILINGFWFENAGDGKTWIPRQYTATYTHRSVALDAADIDADSRLDIVLSPSEPLGGMYRISWFQAPADPTRSEWTEHIVEDSIETVHHSMCVADFNLDGRMDFATAKMSSGLTPAEVKVFLNGGEGQIWRKRVIAVTGSHGMRLVDVDGNGGKGLFGANWRGRIVDLWINQAETLQAVDGEDRQPKEFLLKQNYPNPFNPATEIEFQIPAAGHVRLVVYDSLGKLLAVLVDGQREAGRHRVRWDGGAAASGVYLYRLEAGSFVQTRRMTLLK